jgi:hypothetical protein
MREFDHFLHEGRAKRRTDRQKNDDSLVPPAADLASLKLLALVAKPRRAAGGCASY